MDKCECGHDKSDHSVLCWYLDCACVEFTPVKSPVKTLTVTVVRKDGDSRSDQATDVSYKDGLLTVTWADGDFIEVALYTLDTFLVGG